MKISLVICTRNRAAQLTEALGRLDRNEIVAESAELVLVDSASTDATPKVIAEFAESAPFPVRQCRVDRPGLGRARNEGVKNAMGELIAFTDDDCYLGLNYFRELNKSFNPLEAQYGAGELRHYNLLEDGGAGHLIPVRATIPAYSLLPAGVIQGANMFAHKSVFAAVGPFNDAMGAGTPFPCEDIEFAARCSLAGFVGVLLPNVRVYHDHRRKLGTREGDEALRDYDFGRGAYYASLLQRGVGGAWQLWSAGTPVSEPVPAQTVERLATEMEGASRYLRHLAASREAT